MDIHKILKCIKQAAQSFSIVAGAISAIFAVVGVFVGIPPFVSLPIATGIGLIYGAVSGKNAASEHDAREAASKHIDKERAEAIKEVHEMKKELNELRKGLLPSPKASKCDSKAIYAGLKTRPANDGTFFNPDMESTAEVVVPIRSVNRQKTEKAEIQAATEEVREPERQRLGMC